MKSVRTLRLLSLLSFLLLMAPFYKQCNIRKAEPTAEEIRIDTTAIETPTDKNSNVPIAEKEEIDIKKDTIAQIENNKTPFYQKAYEFIDDSETLSPLEFAYVSKDFFKSSFSKFKVALSKDFKRTINDLVFGIRSFSFVFIVFITFFIFILSFTKKNKWVYKLSIANLCLVILTLICILFFDPFFETYKQIKWGYYAFTLVQIGIYYTSKIQISSSKS